MEDVKQSAKVEEIKPPIPIKVLRSKLPQFNSSGTPVESKQEEKQEKVVVKPKVVESKPKGTITIRLYHNKPYEVDFEGDITGRDRDIAWRAMMKEYAVWKANLAKQPIAGKQGGNDGR